MKKYMPNPINSGTTIFKYEDRTHNQKIIHIGRMRELIFEEDEFSINNNKTLMFSSKKFIGHDLLSFLDQIEYKRSKDYFINLNDTHLKDAKLHSFRWNDLVAVKKIGDNEELINNIKDNKQSWLKATSLNIVFNMKNYNLKAITKSKELIPHITDSSHHILIQFFNEFSELISLHIQDLNKNDGHSEYFRFRIFKNVQNESNEILIHSEDFKLTCENIHRYPFISLMKKNLIQQEISLPDSFIVNRLSENSILMDRNEDNSFMNKITLQNIIGETYKNFKIRPFNLYITDKTHNEEWKIIPSMKISSLDERAWLLSTIS